MPRITNLSNKTKFGKLICKNLSDNGKSQKNFAQEIGLTQVYVYQLLNGVYQPSVKTLFSISKATGISIEKLTEALLDES